MTTSRSSKPSNRPAGTPVSNGAALDFTDDHGTYSGVDEHGRQWCITRTVTGWRLEFRDPGDLTATYAGTHPSLERARVEALR